MKSKRISDKVAENDLSAQDKKMFEKYCRVGASRIDLITMYGEERLSKFCKKHYGLDLNGTREYFDTEGKLAIREAQYTSAVEKLNPVMLIWNGKQRLGQSDDPTKDKLDEERNNTIKGLIEAVKNIT